MLKGISGYFFSKQQERERVMRNSFHSTSFVQQFFNRCVLISINYLFDHSSSTVAAAFHSIQLMYIYIIVKRVQISCLLLFDKNEQEKKNLTRKKKRRNHSISMSSVSNRTLLKI